MLVMRCVRLIAKPDVGRLAFRAYPGTGLSRTGGGALR
jgi:hypothetical protein